MSELLTWLIESRKNLFFTFLSKQPNWRTFEFIRFIEVLPFRYEIQHKLFQPLFYRSSSILVASLKHKRKTYFQLSRASEAREGHRNKCCNRVEQLFVEKGFKKWRVRLQGRIEWLKQKSGPNPIKQTKILSNFTMLRKCVYNTWKYFSSQKTVKLLQMLFFL